MKTTCQIELPTGETTLVDKADEKLVSGFKWRALRQPRTTYVHAWHNRLHVYLHRLIIGAGPNDTVDHVNRNGLDNRRSNLRLATRSQNGANRSADNRSKVTTSSYKGVSWDKSRKRWIAYIHVNGKTRWIGRFDDEEVAARSYDEQAIKEWGEFARLNFP